MLEWVSKGRSSNLTEDGRKKQSLNVVCNVKNKQTKNIKILVTGFHVSAVSLMHWNPLNDASALKGL